MAATYKEAMKAINTFLTDINKLPALPESMFQGVFVKKLSNSNLVSSKKYTDITTGEKTHQSHLDLTGQSTLEFFFGENPEPSAGYTQIMIDIPVDHLRLLQTLDHSTSYISERGNTKKKVYVLKRDIPSNFHFTHTSDLYYSAYAFKKLEGHSGDQNQINRLQHKDEFFDLCTSAYEGDLLIFMKLSLCHFICILIPCEYSAALSALIGNKINFSVQNPGFNPRKSSEEFCSIMKKNVKQEFDDINTDIQSAYNGLNGHDKEQLTKARVGQSSFRKLLIEQRGCTCELCSISIPEVLRASHIKSWADSTPEERLDLQNGLLLCANHDALFDRHMITIDADTNELLISSSIQDNQIADLNLIDVKHFSLGDRMKAYMRNHNKIFKA